jgi:hypothetical protein
MLCIGGNAVHWWRAEWPVSHLMPCGTGMLGGQQCVLLLAADMSTSRLQACPLQRNIELVVKGNFRRSTMIRTQGSNSRSACSF